MILSLAMIAQCWFSGTALACAFDMIKPERTSIDWIVDSETLVLARPKETDPFAFRVTRVLVGTVDGVAINQLVDSTTRARLASNPSHAVLFAYQAETGWRRVAFVNEDFNGVLETALENRPSWKLGMPQSRLDFIVALQGNSTPVLKTLVIAELDKVPYEDLREMDLSIPVETLLADLWTMDGYRYQAIHALLLGLSDTPAAKVEIRDFIERVKTWDWANNLGAFAAAYIEHEGADAVQKLSNEMLLDPNQPLDKLEQIVMAFSVHHDLADPFVRHAIQEALATLVNQRPKAGVIVARQFSLRSNWSLAHVLEPLVRERAVALGDLIAIAVYLGHARGVSGEPNRAVFK